MTDKHREMADKLLRRASTENSPSVEGSDYGETESSVAQGRGAVPRKLKKERRRANSLHAVGRTYVMEALSFFEGRETNSARCCLEQIICLHKANFITDVGAEVLVQELVDRNNEVWSMLMELKNSSERGNNLQFISASVLQTLLLHRNIHSKPYVPAQLADPQHGARAILCRRAA
jgi:hypothetical protein